MVEWYSSSRSVACHMGSHICRPTQEEKPGHNPMQSGRHSIYLPQRNGRLSWPRQLELDKCVLKQAVVSLIPCWPTVGRVAYNVSSIGYRHLFPTWGSIRQYECHYVLIL